MASRREYTYQIKGNKLSLLEKDYTTSDGLGLAGVSTDGTQYGTSGDGITDDIPSGTTVVKSPLLSVTDGIEIEYAYSPIYNLEGSNTIGVNKFFINGWTVVNGYLTFLRQDYSSGDGGAHIDFTGSPYSLSDGDYIVINGSDRWNGLHKVQINAANPGTESALATYTKTSSIFPYYENQDIDTNESEEIFDGGGGNLWLANYFSAGNYIWLSGFTNEQACGLFRIGSVTKSDTPASSKLTVDVKYFVQSDSQPLTNLETDDGYPIDEEIALDTAALMVANSGESDINIYGAQRDFCSLRTGINTLNDESDTIDIPSYLSKALVYYVKAKVAEDQMNIEVKEYMMREFKKMVEKHESSKVSGPRMIMSGNNAIR